MKEKKFSDDYSYSKDNKCNIDMVLSGKYLDERNLTIDINSIQIDEYPSEERIEYLKGLLASKYDKNKDNIILGAASNGILQNLVKLFFKNGGTLLVSEFSFAQPEYAVLRIGGNIKRVKTHDYVIDFENFINEIKEDTKAVFLCNPNNPTGYYYDPLDIIGFAKKVDIPVIVSEAAIEFSKGKSLLNYELPENIILTRTFSKAYGLAGLRIGYSYLSGKYLDLYKKSITRFEVSSLSVEVAIKMLEDYTIDKNVDMIIKEREYLQTELDMIGIETLKSNSNAFMSKHEYSNNFFELLKEYGITVAKIKIDSDDYFYFRVAVQKEEINKLFINTLKQIDINEIKKYERKI